MVRHAKSDHDQSGSSRSIHPGTVIDQGKGNAATVSHSPREFYTVTVEVNSYRFLGKLLRSVSKEENSLRMKKVHCIRWGT